MCVDAINAPESTHESTSLGELPHETRTDTHNLGSIPQTQPSLSLLLHDHGEIEFSHVSSPYTHIYPPHASVVLHVRGGRISRSKCTEDWI